MADALTPGATARLLGVSPSTLRSWDRRYGVGPRERSPGGHRRYSPADVARLRELCRLVGEGLPPASAAERVLDPVPGGRAPAPASPVVPRQRGAGEGARSRWRPGGDTLPLGAAGPALQGIARAAMRMDAELVERLLEEALDGYGVVAAWEDLAMPLLYGMGRKWEDTRRYVEVEHLLSWCVSSALRRVAAPADATGRPAVLACGPGQMHSLPMEALAAALRERGVPRRVLGPCTPVAATVRAVRRTGPRAVVLWSHAGNADDVAALRAVVREAAGSVQATAVYTAGPGWRTLGAAPGLAAGHLGSLTDAVRALVPG
ncbi:MerR family transcriptional regulator [Nocardiopsis deserti]|uniref:MerR family transcriptional regulator n=1 Tax=Nocardiopsis deserti TaxID=2605988 RepID=UPI00123AF9EB|nr:MerR family transcriptional regulator [Nocardiopsis deserti]